MDIVGLWMFHSNSASIWYKKLHEGRHRIAKRSFQFPEVVLSYSWIIRMEWSGIFWLLGKNKLTSHDSLAIGATDAVWIVTIGYKSSLSTSKGKSIGTRLKDCLSCGTVTLVIIVTVFFMRKESSILSVILSAQCLPCLSSSLLAHSYSMRGNKKNIKH